jgi:hypothetical protein
MPGSTNFIQWNPNGVNQEDDAAYAADSLRSAGAPTNAIYPSPTANKSFFQWSTFIAAFASMLATKGYSPNDGSADPPTSINNLAAVLANVMTQADMSPYALLASPHFSGDPQAPTAAPGDSDLSIANTAFVSAAVAAAGAGISFNYATNSGFIKFGATFGNLILQWKLGSHLCAANGRGVITETWPTAFLNRCMAAFATVHFDNPVNTGNWQGVGLYVNSITTTQVSMYHDVRGDGSADSNYHAFILGVGI